jgi:hypothetical protein
MATVNMSFSLDQSEKYSEALLASFELTNKFTIPSDYRSFLLEYGVGSINWPERVYRNLL